MPIYAYRCEACGHAKDVLQKISDPVLSVCPACGAASFRKQLTAAGFQLKGSGWYATDFKGGSGTSAAATTSNGASGDAAAPSAGASSESTAASTATASSGGAATGGCGASCACH